MAYRLDLNENFSIYRSRHTGAIGFWERNPHAGYYAAREYLPEGAKLTVRKLLDWASLAGVDGRKALDEYVAMVRKGGNGMIPKPDFSITELNF